MGPPIFIGGRDLMSGRRPEGASASMGPPIFIGGRLVAGQTLWALVHARFNGAADFHRRKGRSFALYALDYSASMGPPIFIGGRIVAPCRALLLILLQWGRRFSSAEGYTSRLPCIISRNSLQWGRRFSSAEGFFSSVFISLCVTSFNGAADFHRRKASRSGCTSLRGCASLQWGRPIFIGGRRNLAPTVRDAENRFNGARRFSSAEGLDCAWDCHAAPSRFNGAADFHRRKGPLPALQRAMEQQLQWGRRFSSAEGFCGLVQFIRHDLRLQWGRRFSSAEGHRTMDGGGETIRASMGPPIFIGGRPGLPPQRPGVRQASMGPPIFHRRKGKVAGAGGTPANQRLQWGRRFFIGGRYPSGDSHACRRMASMGAADFHRRKAAVAGSKWYAARTLQWGRRFSSAEGGGGRE